MSSYIIKNVKYFDGSNNFQYGTLYIHNGRYVDVIPSDCECICIDGTDLTAIPGLIDIHLHGCDNQDVCDNSSSGLEKISAYQRAHGIAYFLPATMTLPLKNLCDILGTLSHTSPDSGILGINLEGPFISPERCGAQDAAHILSCDIGHFDELMNAAADKIRIINVAPEIQNALSFIRQLKKKYPDIIVSLAHTNADYEQARAAFAGGASHITHLFNAMPGLHHRNPGIIGAAMENPDCTVEIICDGVHIHPSVIRAAFKMFDNRNIIFISDSMRAAGLGDGTYSLGGQDVTVKGNTALLSKNDTLAGSVCNLMQCLQYAIFSAGIKPENAIACTTINPARKLGIAQQYGAIRTGMTARLVLVDKDWNIVRNLINII